MKNSLPDSADDLLIKDGKLLMRSLTVYEIFRRFGHILRLSPFRFEDFSAALLADEQSPLIAEIHIQILKTLIREDRQQQTWLGPTDVRDSVNVYLHLADHVNWPSALRIYLSADTRENAQILEQLSGNGSKSYPFNVDTQIKLDVLEHLCDQFLSSNVAREEIVNGNNSIEKHDTICRLCSKGNGDLVQCKNCPAIYHLKCSDPPLETYPDSSESYLCSVCKSNHVMGVSDCIDSHEQAGNLKRSEPLGIDESGRRYWFLIRRVFVIDEDENDVRYYTKKSQFDALLKNLDEEQCDDGLIDVLQEQKEEIERQMKITEDLYSTLMRDYKKEDGSYSQVLGQNGAHKNYTNHYSSSNLAISKNQHSDRDINRSLANKFCINMMNSFRWYGAINGNLSALTLTIRSTLIKFESSLPSTFIHPCWSAHRPAWIKSINFGLLPEDYAIALSELESCIKPILYKSAWTDCVGFSQLFRSTLAEREELKKTDRQPRGFERREWFSQDFELSFRLGTNVKFSSKLKPVKHQVWKQKGEEYRITGLNAWFWRSKTFKSRPRKPTRQIKEPTIPEKPTVKKSILLQPKLPPCHDFLTKRNKIRSLLVLPDLELRKLARCGGMRETKSFSYTAKQNSYIWPYGMTPRPTFRTCWLYKNRTINTLQDVALQLKVLYACIRWDDLQVRPPASGHNVISTDDSTITIQLMKKRDKLPYLNHSEYLIKKVITPIETPTKYKKVGVKKVSTPSARSGLRARRQVEVEEEKGPTTEEVWVPEDQLELWEIKHFDERIERQNQMIRERAMREEAEKRRKIEEEKRKLDQERRRKLEEEAKKARIAASQAAKPIIGVPTTPNAALRPTNSHTTTPTTPVLRYFRTEQGQIIRLPASYLQRGTPLILRHVGPGPNQTNTYIIRPQITNVVVNTTGVTSTSTINSTEKPKETATIVGGTTPVTATLIPTLVSIARPQNPATTSAIPATPTQTATTNVPVMTTPSVMTTKPNIIKAGTSPVAILPIATTQPSATPSSTVVVSTTTSAQIATVITSNSSTAEEAKETSTATTNPSATTSPKAGQNTAEVKPEPSDTTTTTATTATSTPTAAAATKTTTTAETSPALSAPTQTPAVTEQRTTATQEKEMEIAAESAPLATEPAPALTTIAPSAAAAVLPTKVEVKTEAEQSVGTVEMAHDQHAPAT